MIDKSRFAKAATGTVDVTKEQRPTPIDLGARELDDAFSAWDEDDAGAHQPSHPSQLPQATRSTMAKTRIVRKPLAASTSTTVIPPGDAQRAPPPAEEAPEAPDPIRLTDPVSMHDIMISRTHTIDDPLTTRLLAEISRTATMNDRVARTRSGLMFLPTAGVVERARETATAELSDLIVTDPDSGITERPRRVSSEEEPRAGQRTTRRLPVDSKEEPFRKK